MAPEQLGPYRIGRRLGRGGMGTVYAAVDSQSGEHAAVKVLSGSMTDDVGFRERFEAEVESLRMLRHENIVRILGFGEQDGLLFYAMELVDGRSLEEEIRAGSEFPWRDVASLGTQICRALKHAHDRGVIHRDLKPANLLLSPGGVVKLSDFGIAKLFGSAGLTADGGVVGTAEYMAPEQADGRPVTHRCDLYSLGGVLYTLLARRPPFRANTFVEMLQLQRFADPEPVSRYAADVPKPLEKLIMQLLSKDPDVRVQTATALARRLDDLLADSTPEQALDHDLTSPSKAQPPGGSLQLTTDDPIRARLPQAAELHFVSPADVHQSDVKLAESEVSRDPPRGQSGVEHRARSPSAESAADVNANSGNGGAGSRIGSASANRFTAVSKAEMPRQHETVEEPSPWISWQTWVILACLLAITGVAWYALRPPSANQLYEAIMAASQDGSDAALLRVQPEIEKFISQYPNDARKEEVYDVQDELKLLVEQKKLEKRAESNTRRDAVDPIKEEYLTATRYARLDLNEGIRRLRLFVDLYGSPRAEPGEQAAITLARKQIVELENLRAKWVLEHMEILEGRMQHASMLADSDRTSARRIWNAVFVLFKDCPWATKFVREAEKNLARYPANTGSDR